MGSSCYIFRMLSTLLVPASIMRILQLFRPKCNPISARRTHPSAELLALPGDGFSTVCVLSETEVIKGIISPSQPPVLVVRSRRGQERGVAAGVVRIHPILQLVLQNEGIRKVHAACGTDRNISVWKVPNLDVLCRVDDFINKSVFALAFPVGQFLLNHALNSAYRNVNGSNFQANWCSISWKN